MSFISEVMSQNALLSLYRAEKEAWELNQPVFPSYSEWKVQEDLEADNPGDEKAIRSLYLDDKADIIGAFKSFKEWKVEYEKEWLESHETSSFVSASMGMDITDAETAYVIS